MDAADLGRWQRTRRCVPREASRTLLAEAPRLPKTARTSRRAARPGRVVSAGIRPGARTAKGTRARLSDSVHRRNASRRLRPTDSAPFRRREAGPRPGLRRHCDPARHGRRGRAALTPAPPDEAGVGARSIRAVGGRPKREPARCPPWRSLPRRSGSEPIATFALDPGPCDARFAVARRALPGRDGWTRASAGICSGG
jgi:hypothetical protein